MQVRKLLGETWGFLCPVHTPDGAPCGLLLHLTQSAGPVALPPDRKVRHQQTYDRPRLTEHLRASAREKCMGMAVASLPRTGQGAAEREEDRRVL